MSHFKVFSSKCYILDTKCQLGRFDSKNQNLILLGYSFSSYRVYNLQTICIEESSDVVFDEGNVTREFGIDYDERTRGSGCEDSYPSTNKESSKKEMEYHKTTLKS